MNRLTKHLFVILFILSVGYKSYAQRRPMPNFNRPFANRPNNYNNAAEQRMENIKERFLNRQLALTPEQARKFFPLYAEYQREIFNIRRLKRLNNTNAVDGTDQINKDLYYDSELVNIKQKFNDAFLKILPPEKVSELYKSEREFNDELVRSLYERSEKRLN
jgi:hypothetical protein